MDWIRSRRGPASGDDFEAMESDLDRLFAVPVPPMAFEPTAASDTRVRRRSRRRPAFALALGAIALAVVAAVVTPFVFGGGAEEVSAEEVFQRASDVAKSGAMEANYHLVTRATMNGNEAMTSEIWSRGKSHTRSETRYPDGGVFGMAVAGTEGYLWATVDGTLRAVHVKDGAGAWVDSQASPSSLPDLLNQYGDGSCLSAEFVRDDELLGRDVYVIAVSPRPECPKLAGIVSRGESVELPLGPGFLEMWVDRETFVTLRTEGNYAGSRPGYVYEATVFESGVDIPDSVFTYVPPAGVQMVEVDDVSAAKAALSGGEKPAAIEQER